MRYEGVILTGTSGSGKTTVSREICERKDSFKRVKAVTTRSERKDDRENDYDYLTEDEFKKIKSKGKLITSTEYRGSFYGIEENEYRKVKGKNNLPLLILTPSSAKDFIESPPIGKDSRFFNIFLDASDKQLNSRLKDRGEKIKEEMTELRSEDRKLKSNFLYSIENKDLETTVNIILKLWETRDTGGPLPQQIIKQMAKAGMLFENNGFEPDNIEPASYDLRLGDECYVREKIKKLDSSDPFLRIDPYDYAIVTSKETVNLPPDIAGRFDLSVGTFFRGIILSNGPQVDPGFKGKLFCLLFNTSNQEVSIKRGNHYATLEFRKLVEPTKFPYEGEYQGKKSLEKYLKKDILKGAVHDLKNQMDKIEETQKELQKVTSQRNISMMTIALGFISLVLAVIAVIVAIFI